MTKLLNHLVFGERSPKSTLIIAHGLFGSARNWRGIAKQLCHDRQVVVVDMRNHGQSFWNESHTYFDMADDLLKVAESLEHPVDLMGHSMGGKAAMMLALETPDVIQKLLVVDIAPVTYGRSHVGHIEAMQNLDLSQITRKTEAIRALEHSIPDIETRAFLAQSLKFEDSVASWELNLDTLKRHMPEIVGFPEMPSFFERTTTFIRGGKSDYVQVSSNERINSSFPQNSIIEIPNAGHWVHAEAPNEFIRAVQTILS